MYGYPADQAAAIATGTLSAMAGGDFDSILLVAFPPARRVGPKTTCGPDMERILREALARIDGQAAP